MRILLFFTAFLFLQSVSFAEEPSTAVTKQHLSSSTEDFFTIAALSYQNSLFMDYVKKMKHQASSASIMTYLLENGADPNFKFNDYTPLHIASQRGSLQLAQILLAHGADINAIGGKNGYGIPRDVRNVTPLDMAYYYGRDEMMEFLKSKGGKRNHNDSFYNKRDCRCCKLTHYMRGCGIWTPLPK